jgi:hypothetical protein
MAKRTLAPDERRMIGWLAAVMASYDSPDRIIRVFVRSRTSEDGKPQVAVTSAPRKPAPRMPN